jgi:hypothetical protein
MKPSPTASHSDNASRVDGDLASEQVEVNPMMHLVAPLVAVGATFVVRKALEASYRGITGRQVPAPRDPNVAWGQALVWAMATAAVAAAVEVAVYRGVNQAGGSR